MPQHASNPEERAQALRAERELIRQTLARLNDELDTIEREADRETRVRWLDGQRRVIAREYGEYDEDAHP
jgi:hypothetical protein